MLDIIVPHYNEPWEVGKKFFDMLGMQRGVNFDDINVILVNDGSDYWLRDELFEDYPYKVQNVVIPHGGVSAARNYGLSIAKNEWVMFCDFDDTFTTVYSLRDYLMQLPAPNYDVLWATIYIEVLKYDSNLLIYPCGEDNRNTVTYLHGKIYRRQYLIDNNLTFDTELSFAEDHLFNMILLRMVDQKRIGKLSTETPPYIWTVRKGSVTESPERKEEQMVARWVMDRKLCEAFKKLKDPEYNLMTARTIWDMYYMLNIPNLSDNLLEIQKEVGAWSKEHEADFQMISSSDLYACKKVSESECKKSKEFKEDVSFKMWLDKIQLLS